MAQQCIYCLEASPHPRLGRGEQYKCGYKPYRCEICDYSTTTKGNLSIHMQSDKHINNLKELKENKTTTNDATNTTITITTTTTATAISTGGQPKQTTIHDSDLNVSMDDSSDCTSQSPLRVKNKLPHYGNNNGGKQQIHHLNKGKAFHNIFLTLHLVFLKELHTFKFDVLTLKHEPKFTKNS